MELIFEKSRPGHGYMALPECDVPEYKLDSSLLRESAPRLPELSEGDLSRHYAALARRCHGVCSGFYPLGSCTMKYNPKLNERIAALDGWNGVHPLQPDETVQGCLEALTVAESFLKEITGMDAVTFQPAAGAHGEFTGLLLIKAYHLSRGDSKRTKMIIPDSAHGTNPASASMCGFETVTIASNDEGMVDLDQLRAAVGEDTAGLMLTNPNTVGLFDKNILEITKIVHEAGGLCYYDGANLNAVMGVVRPGDMGFDVMHMNLHKTFSTPHGGGGPGSGPVACKELLKKFLPTSATGGSGNNPDSVGQVRSFYGNFTVVIKALTYILSLGAEGIREAAENAVLNANYMKALLAPHYDMAYDHVCMHEFVMTLDRMKKDVGVTAIDVAKALLDEGIHPPTMYFPLIVHEALMIEPTETESRETLDEAAQVFIDIAKRAYKEPAQLHAAPLTTPIGRPDETKAARTPVVKYGFEG